jgi:hypothetical protein
LIGHLAAQEAECMEQRDAIDRVGNRLASGFVTEQRALGVQRDEVGFGFRMR